jgi:hypothetical protein
MQVGYLNNGRKISVQNGQLFPSLKVTRAFGRSISLKRETRKNQTKIPLGLPVNP